MDRLEGLRADVLLARSRERMTLLNLETAQGQLRCHDASVAASSYYSVADTVPTVSRHVTESVLRGEVDSAERDHLDASCSASEMLHLKKAKDDEVSMLIYCVCGPCAGRCPHPKEDKD